MPHFVVEYTANLDAEVRIGRLLTAVNEAIAKRPEVFPIGGIRSRAVRVTEYAIADGAADYAFVHAVLTIGSGRSAELRRAVGDEIFAVMKAHFAELQSKRYLALSLELNEFAGTWKANNIHERFEGR
ncbi:MAG: 5-carboxymethyl-2-hydroxymuconate Delta-isomerase [Gemmatimonadetes bacterium]|nr:5-carboxymethyl-2-hydroxymuconate Delta-isomerase [Gemmatimonadota bacterium]